MEENRENILKEFSATKIVYLIVALLLVGMVILYAGNTFRQPKVTSVEKVSNTKILDESNSSAEATILSEINSLEEKVNKNPEDLDALLSLSHLLNDSGFYKKAIESYNKYLVKIPDNVNVIVDLGVCYFQLGNYDSAIKTIERGISLNPKHQIAHFNLGIINSANGDIAKSKEYFKKAVKLDPNSEIGIKAQNLLDNH